MEEGTSNRVGICTMQLLVGLVKFVSTLGAIGAPTELLGEALEFITHWLLGEFCFWRHGLSLSKMKRAGDNAGSQLKTQRSQKSQRKGCFAAKVALRCALPFLQNAKEQRATKMKRAMQKSTQKEAITIVALLRSALF